ncbi:MAG: general secretion pathway protein GspK [Planctomycetes bacterium]|nr:general secretion pathway protein GspK [Planctomycetota bacterium]
MRNDAPRGIVLVIVLIVVVILALAAYAFCELMITQREATEYAGRQAQARMLVDSGVASTRKFLMQDPATLLEAGGHFDNPAYFQAQLVVDDPDPNLRGRFSVLSPLLDDVGYPGGLRYGLENESARVNINALPWLEKQPLMEGMGRNLLMALPNMTEDVADAILDYIDEDIEPREFGAEDEYYMTLDPPYAAKNAPLDTVEELLLVPGVTPQLLFGADVNRNGVLDPHEMTAAVLGESPDGSMDRGWSGYLTLWSMERNVNLAGLPRIYINQDDLAQLQEQLSAVFEEEWVKFIIAYRQYGPYEDEDPFGPEPVVGQPAEAIEIDTSRQGETKIARIIDLIGARVRVSEGGGGGGRGRGGDNDGGGAVLVEVDDDLRRGGPSGDGPSGDSGEPNDDGEGGRGGGRGGNDDDDDATIYESPFPEDPVAMAAYLPILLDNVSVNASAWIPGRINVNQAPRTLLLGVPGLSEEIVDTIIAERQMEDPGEDPNRRFETWLLTSGIVTLGEMKALSAILTAGGDVYRAQVVGYYEDGAAAARSEVIIDATQSTPRILFWRDITHLGRGYPLDILGIETTDEL